MTTAKGPTSCHVPMGAVFMSDDVYNTMADEAGKALVVMATLIPPIP